MPRNTAATSDPHPPRGGSNLHGNQNMFGSARTDFLHLEPHFRQRVSCARHAPLRQTTKTASKATHPCTSPLLYRNLEITLIPSLLSPHKFQVFCPHSGSVSSPPKWEYFVPTKGVFCPDSGSVLYPHWESFALTMGVFCPHNGSVRFPHGSVSSPQWEHWSSRWECFVPTMGVFCIVPFGGSYSEPKGNPS